MSSKYGYYDYVNKQIFRTVLDSETEEIPYNAVKLRDDEVGDWLTWRIVDHLCKKVWE